MIHFFSSCALRFFFLFCTDVSPGTVDTEHRTGWRQIRKKTTEFYLLIICGVKFMADQEFLASFGVEIDESGLDRLQKALKENRTLAEQLASAFDSARNAVSEFFKQLSASTLPSGELSPYQRLMEMSEKGISFSMDLDTTDADGTLRAFMENAQQFFDSAPLPLTADESPLVKSADDTLFMLQDMYGETQLPLIADASAVVSAGQDALAQLQALFASTHLSVNASVNISGGLSGSSDEGRHRRRVQLPTMTEIAEDGDPEYVIPVKKGVHCPAAAAAAVRGTVGFRPGNAAGRFRGEGTGGRPVRPAGPAGLRAGGRRAGDQPDVEFLGPGAGEHQRHRRRNGSGGGGEECL